VYGLASPPGWTLVGDLSSAQEGGVVGEMPNLAARLQTLAAPLLDLCVDRVRHLPVLLYTRVPSSITLSQCR